jgi:type II secretory pathway pseudopilin PulG
MMRLLKRFFSFARSKGGFTLVEATASIAVIGTLAAIALPIAIDKIDQSKKTAADGDTKDIATAIAGLIYDVSLDNLGKSTSLTATRLGFTVGATNLALDPDRPFTTGSTTVFYNDATGIWKETKADGGAAWVAGDEGSFHDNLVVNNLDGDLTINESNGDDYLPANWRGPYLSEPKDDPWGKSYVANIQGMRNGIPPGGSGAVLIFGWVLSAGPNNQLDTEDTVATLGSDDRGIMLFKKE